jgi:hypothetical protein
VVDAKAFRYRAVALLRIRPQRILDQFPLGGEFDQHGLARRVQFQFALSF